MRELENLLKNLSDDLNDKDIFKMDIGVIHDFIDNFYGDGHAKENPIMVSFMMSAHATVHQTGVISEHLKTIINSLQD